ncbi:MAG TPA: LysR substrate-binding domain-containing protein [Rhodopila sp.]|uniref:LysR family transcriptional regulator n=1 Tax=Rhodopila sp. TaxID=2480087 RepID=UPI002CAC50EB|nr:LysR substrate-binding domain-containing protein [Rhodopila sp.]HVY16184.1 LysR substrate-binding domain-containing protein [Rhodopila sp.]
MDMDYAELRVLEAVARHGSMNRAAVELNMVQSNVTARIRILEEQVGTPLFDRSRRGVTLTPAGQRLLPYAARLSALLKEAYDAARDDGVPRGALRVGSLETTAALRLPPILAAYTQAYPGVDVALTTGTSQSLIEDVLDYRVDGAFVAGPVQHPDLAEEPVFQEELVLVTAPGIRTLKEMGQLREVKIIVFRRGCSYRQRLENLMAQQGVQTARPLEFGSLDAIIGCVAAGVGITLLPKAVVGPFWREGRVAAHDLPAKDARVATTFVHRNDIHPSSALKAFLAVARPSPLQAVAAE